MQTQAHFLVRKSNNTFEVNRKEELLRRKYADITADFVMMFEEGLRIGVIYDRLSDKYYLDKGTIFRIVSNQTKFQKANDREAESP